MHTRTAAASEGGGSRTKCGCFQNGLLKIEIIIGIKVSQSEVKLTKEMGVIVCNRYGALSVV